MDQKSETPPPAPLPSTRHSLPIALIRARESVMAPIRLMLADTGLTEQQWRVLRVLMESGPIDASQLANRAGLLAPSLTRIIQAMSKQGYISRGPDPADRRRQVIAILPAGQRIIEANQAEAAAIAQSFRDRLGDADYDRLLTLLDQLIE
ncbi:homoprotocatechuate degradation operon regulator HpaR [Aliiroseovarius crassostreae]|uniref:homoprotocatechuate degradation operon regulator HpaR n=1 Tax=Aliiroseovarius crassostreae TaxID=154981 RepID=UPI003C7B4D1F